MRCLSAGAQQQLERDLDVYVHYGMLVPGASQAHSRPGSAVLFLNDGPADGCSRRRPVMRLEPCLCRIDAWPT